MIFLLPLIVVAAIPFVILAFRLDRRRIERDRRMGITAAPLPPLAVGDIVQPADGTTDYWTVLYIRPNMLLGTQVTAQNNRSTAIKTDHRNAWRKAELTW